MKAFATFNFDGAVSAVSLTLRAETPAEKCLLLMLTEKRRAVVVERSSGHHTNPPDWVRFEVGEAAQED